MIKYAAIVPHSPLLLGANQPRQVAKAFKEIANDLKKENIKHILSLSPHALFQRAGFSAYVDKEYTIAFPEFGDLLTEIKLPIWWTLFHRLRETSNEHHLEALQNDHIDYGHGIPLIKINKDDPPNVLCINSDPNKSNQQQFDFGVWLGENLNQLDEPSAVFCSGDLCTTKTPNRKLIEKQNDNFQKTIKNDQGITTNCPTVIIPSSFEGI